MTTYSGHGIRAFLNIPYAEPPIGKLRFANPVPKKPWSEDLSNSEQVIVCPQVDVFFSGPTIIGQEDCLYLNVYVPLNPKSNDPLPVMFFIHGGAFANGNGGPTLYGPEFLLEGDVILVSGNYRLGALGFLSTLTEHFSGNYGLKDQALMLQWIQENIAEFGGDPERVTIFGESAGAGSVGYHLLSPVSKGMFHRAILQSGTAFAPWTNMSHPKAIAFAQKMFDALGCEYSRGNYESTLDCAREKDEKEFISNMVHFMEWDVYPIEVFAPVKEIPSPTAFITREDYENKEAGNDVPIMIGVAANEGGFSTAMIQLKPESISELEREFDSVVEHLVWIFDSFDTETMKKKVKLIKKHYFNGKNFNWDTNARGMIELTSDILFLAGLPQTLKQRFEDVKSEDTFVYQFNYRGSASFTDIALRLFKKEVNFGVSHIDDLLYLFPIVEKAIKSRVMSKEDHKMRKHMVKMWTNFAATGNPSTGYMSWTPAKSFPVDYMRIGNCNLDACDFRSKLASAMETGLKQDNIKFLDKFFNTNFVKIEEFEYANDQPQFCRL